MTKYWYTTKEGGYWEKAYAPLASEYEIYKRINRRRIIIFESKRGHLTRFFNKRIHSIYLPILSFRWDASNHVWEKQSCFPTEMALTLAYYWAFGVSKSDAVGNGSGVMLNRNEPVASYVLDRLLELADVDDKDSRHRESDDLLCLLLNDLGYSDVVGAYQSFHKHYV